MLLSLYKRLDLSQCYKTLLCKQSSKRARMQHKIIYTFSLPLQAHMFIVLYTTIVEHSGSCIESVFYTTRL